MRATVERKGVGERGFFPVGASDRSGGGLEYVMGAHPVQRHAHTRLALFLVHVFVVSVLILW